MIAVFEISRSSKLEVSRRSVVCLRYYILTCRRLLSQIMGSASNWHPHNDSCTVFLLLERKLQGHCTIILIKIGVRYSKVGRSNSGALLMHSDYEYHISGLCFFLFKAVSVEHSNIVILLEFYTWTSQSALNTSSGQRWPAMAASPDRVGATLLPGESLKPCAALLQSGLIIDSDRLD